jgi:hypothetical protein
MNVPYSAIRRKTTKNDERHSNFEIFDGGRHQFALSRRVMIAGGVAAATWLASRGTLQAATPAAGAEVKEYDVSDRV